MKKSISKVLSLVLALAFVFSLAACGGAPSSAPAASGSAPASGSEPAAPADPTTLKVYTWWDVTKFEHLQKMQQDFEAANPDIKLEFVTIPSKYADTMVTKLAGGEIPDVMMLAMDQVPRYALNGMLLPLDDLASQEYKDALYPVVKDALTVDGTKSMSSLGLSENGIEIIKGAQGATGNARIATFAMGFALVMITLVVVLNLVRSRTGRAIMAIRDNRIAAESVGINVTKYKLIAFVTSASLAGAAGALFGLNYSNVTAVQFDFNTSILVLVYVVLGGLGNIWGSIVATVVLYVLPEALRQFSDYRMLVYAIVLILVMLATNNPQVRTLISRIIPRRKGAALDE